jgi:hypothetical protein
MLARRSARLCWPPFWDPLGNFRPPLTITGPDKQTDTPPELAFCHSTPVAGLPGTDWLTPVLGTPSVQAGARAGPRVPLLAA